jgi:hypothetical protein
MPGRESIVEFVEFSEIGGITIAVKIAFKEIVSGIL